MKPQRLHSSLGFSLGRSVLSGGLLALFLFYFAGSTLFTHIHRLGDATVVHSHYYAIRLWHGATGEDAPNHSHSTEQFKTIQQLDCFVFVVSAIALSCAVFRRSWQLRVAFLTTCLPAHQVRLGGRSPPDFL